MNLVNFIKSKYDYVFGFIFFISYRYFFAWLLWRGRGVPPVSDNAYFYLSSANNLFHLQNFEEFRLVIFSGFLNVLSIVTGRNLESAFQLNFYVGPIVMFFALAFFLKKLEADKKIRLLLFVVMALYSGSGAYHGFYWVVPSFYQLALFFVILGFLVSKTKVKTWQIFTSAFLFIFIHPTSIFVSGIFFAYFFIELISKKISSALKNNFSWLALSIIGSFLIYYLIGRTFPSAGSPESFQTNVGLLKSFFSGQAKLISLPVIWQEYFGIFFFNPVSVFAYFVMLYLVFYSRQIKILVIFTSAALLVIAGAFIPYGARTLEFLWPLTFVLIGYSLVGLYKILKKLKIAKYLVIIALFLVITLATIFNLISIKTLNSAKNYYWDRSCPGRLENNKTLFTNLESLYAFNLYGLSQGKGILLTEDHLLQEGLYIVQTIDSPKQIIKLSKMENLLAQKITRRKEQVHVEYPVNFWTQKTTSGELLNNTLAQKGLAANRLYDCQKFIVYKIDKI